MEPHPVLCSASTSAIPGRVVKVARQEEEKRRKRQVQDLVRRNSNSAGDSENDSGQGPVCPFPELRSHEEAMQAGDYALDDVLEGASAFFWSISLSLSPLST